MFLTSRHTYGAVMSVAQGKIRFVRSSGKMKFPRLWFPCDSVTLLWIALKRKDKYHCSKFSGDFRIWGYWFSIYFLFGYCALCWIDQTLNSLVPLWFRSFESLPPSFFYRSCPQHFSCLLLILAWLWTWNKLWYVKDLTLGFLFGFSML